MAFLKDFVYHGSGTECPEPFLTWSGISLLGAVLGRKVWTEYGDYFKTITPFLYVCLVGDAGSGKSTAKNFAKKIIVEHFPNIQTSASFQSHQDIIDQMANSNPLTWKDEAGHYGDIGKIYAYREFFIVANEFASLLSQDKKGMTEFLVDIYDEASFSTGYKGARRDTPDRKQDVENPFLPILACAVPKWFMGNLKLDLFEGGLGRRLIIVYEKKSKDIFFPERPQGGEEALFRCIDHLKKAHEVYGRVYLTEDAKAWMKDWFYKIRKLKGDIDDPILKQFYETMHIQLLKVALTLSMSEYPFTMKIETDHIKMAAFLLNRLEKPVQALTSGIGRNELAGYAAQLLDCLEAARGFMDLKRFRVQFFRHTNEREFMEIVNFLSSTNQIVLTRAEMNGVARDYLFSPDRYKTYCDEASTQKPPSDQSPSA